MRVLIYKRKRIETNVTETNVTKCYGLWVAIVGDAHWIISGNRTTCA